MLSWFRKKVHAGEAGTEGAAPSAPEPQAVEPAQGEAADERLRFGAARPLNGVPVAIKGILLTRGVPNTVGSRVL